MNSDTTKTRNFLVINQQGEHEYNIVVTQIDPYGRTYQLKSSNNESWAEQYRNKVLLEMTDTGNGISFDRGIKDCDYDLATYVRILLSFDNSTFSSIELKFKIIEESSIIKL